MMALLLAVVCVCPPAAPRKTDAEFAANREHALRQMREELAAILANARAAFERGER